MNEQNKLEILRHSAAHVLAAAVLEMFPEAKFGTGPAIENGFYYDFDLPRTLIPEDLEILENKMKAIIKANHPFERAEISASEAKSDFAKLRQDYKLELLNELAEAGEKISIYKSGHFVDLCSGPHLDSTGEIKIDAFKLTKISGAYWRADEKNNQMQRVYGVAFESKNDLKEYLHMIEEAEKRDHKKLGRELDLFSFHPEAPGSAFWHPKGMLIWNELEKFGKSIRKKYGNLEIQTPQLAKSILWKTSGHWDHYKDDMFYFDVEEETYCLKPMDCPFNIRIYQTKQRSYKELPIRYTEIGRVMRNEKSGQLNGLLRVRSITQDDAHIFAMESQIEEEIMTLLKMVKEYYAVFEIEPEFYLSTRPENFMGEIPTWNKAESDLKEALAKENIQYKLKEGDGAFYGPKIDIDMKDALGRRWQLATIQLDFQLPQRFELEYVSQDGSKQIPVMIHAAIFGSLERFIGIFIEHTGGDLPTWLSPVQAMIIPVSEEKFGAYAIEVKEKLIAAGVRAEVDATAEGLGKRIRNAEKQKIPYMLVVGEKEMESQTVAMRPRSTKDQTVMSVDEFVEKITLEIKDKK
ncbi:MAG: threonine--tRNA ligase [Candidatus Moranbacteria bacterium]|nr:threonine--tRNA ligase [Candidatus Moranbacteria bacterium]